MAMGKSEKIIGIDLGTTNSCVAILKGRSVRILKNRESDVPHITPSVVSFDKDARLCNVGYPAKNQTIDTDGYLALSAFKRLIGRRFDDEAVQRNIKEKKFSCPVIEADNGDAWVKINGKCKSPLEVSSLVLRKLKDVAEEDHRGPIKSAVITVPAYFDNSQRQATIEAGRIAGLCVRRVINEPTAAALAYVWEKEIRDSKIVIYDLGGGTFDISIIEISETDGKHRINVMSINGDTDLGGEDFDNCIIDYLCEEFKKEHAMDLLNSDDPAPLVRLRDAAEKAKIALSFNKQCDIRIPFIASDEGGPKHIVTKLTRAKLESLVEDLIARTLKPCQIAMEDAGISASDIDDVILVGGQTRMPKVQEAVESFFGKEPLGINVDETIANGAAIQGGILTGDIDDLVIYDCTPLSLGIRTQGGEMTKIIEKNTKIPTKIQKAFKTIKDNQSVITVSIFQGERQRAEDNTLLDQFYLDIPPAPRGEPIEVTFDIDDNGILNVSIMHEATGRKKQKIIAGRSGLSKKQIDQAIRDAEKHAEEDSRFRELADARNDADSEIYNAKKMLSRFVYPEDQSKKTAIDRLISDLEDAMEDNNATQIKSRKMILEKECRRFCELADARNDERMITDGAAKIPDEFGNLLEQSEIDIGYQSEIICRSDSAKEFDNIGTDPNGRDNDGWTPLHESAWNGYSDKVKELIEVGFDPNATNKHGHTPLHLAAFNGCLSVTRELIDAGSDPNTKDEKGNTPLHNIIASGHFAKIEAMINSGSDELSSDSKIAIYDLGGDNFDISIIEASEIDGKHRIDVMSINGDTDLGSEDFDNRIIDYLCEEFKKEHAIDLLNSDDPFPLVRLRDAAEKAKIALSFNKQCDIRIPFIASDEGGPKHIVTKLTRAKLESLVEDLIARTLEPCRIAMKDAGISASDIDDVILVGGPTRMPKIREAVELIFGKEPKQGINVDGMIALRTEIQRGILIYIAAFYGCFGTIKALVKAGANIDEALPDGTKPYDIAADQGHSDAIIAAVAAAKGTYIGAY